MVGKHMVLDNRHIYRCLFDFVLITLRQKIVRKQFVLPSYSRIIHKINESTSSQQVTLSKTRDD